jgi:hypothetical protein
VFKESQYWGVVLSLAIPGLMIDGDGPGSWYMVGDVTIHIGIYIL